MKKLRVKKKSIDVKRLMGSFCVLWGEKGISHMLCEFLIHPFLCKNSTSPRKNSIDLKMKNYQSYSLSLI